MNFSPIPIEESSILEIGDNLSMQSEMRQLLSRKSNRKMPGQEKSDQKQHRSFPENGGSQGSDDRTSPLSPKVDVDGLKLFPENTGLVNPPPTVGAESSSTLGLNLRTASNNGVDQRRVSEKTQYISSKSGPPRVITGEKKNKNPRSYRRCEDEAIHTPGTIQNFGALLALKYDQRGQLEVRIASENSRKILGYGPEQLFSMNSFLDILGHSTRQELVARIDYLLNDFDAEQEETSLDVFPMSITFPFEPEIRLWCAIHLAPSPKGLIICEFEEYVDTFYIKDIDSSKSLPVKQPPHVGVDVSLEEWEKSTRSASKPLPVLNIARQRKNREFSSLDIFNAMTQAEKQIAACKSLDRIYEVIVGVISELTGLHRVMFYRFDSQMNGCIEAELLHPQASPDIFRGLNFPASDIPQQAQDLYKINRIRLLNDRDSETARLVCRNEKDFEQPLDLTHSYLRAISPVHCKYLKNMGVRSTMSISIVIDDKLWGLVACHGYGDKGFRVTPPIRELCRNIGECSAGHIKRLLMQKRIEDRKPLIANQSTVNPKSFVATTSSDLLNLVEADFALLSIDEKIRPIGMIDPYQEALAIMSYLQSCQFNEIRHSHNIKADFPGLSYPSGLTTIGGLLLIPLKVKEGNHLLVFFRKTQARQVNWAGNPFDKKFKAGGHYLEPRSSFKRWGEVIVDTSKEWTEGQLDTASVLATLYGRLIDMAGEKVVVSQSSQMSLIRACSNEVRTPVNEIISYLDTALEQAAGQKMRESLIKAQNASYALTDIMDDLLGLTEGEAESTLAVGETFNLKLTATRVLTVIENDAKRNSLNFNMSVHEKLPTLVKGNGDRFKQLIVYFTSRAFKRSTSVTVNIFLMRTKTESSLVLVQVQDKGSAMSEEELDKAAGEFEEPQYENNAPVPVTDTTPRLDDASGGLSVDITAIGQYVRSLDGQIHVTSEAGKGTIFSIELDFEHPPERPRRLRNLFRSSPLSPQGPLPSLPRPRTPRLTHDDLQGRNEVNGNASDLFSTRSSSLPLVHKTLSPKPMVDDQSLRDLQIKRPLSPYPATINQSQNSLANLNLLIAEAEPQNLRILDERLSQWGHVVDIASDGQECHDRFAANPSKFDVILMDMKLPGVDGTLATRMIRFLEKESEHRNARDPYSAKPRVSIIAVSASLYEEKRFDYVQSGFDGWVMKPIDFRRLDVILQGAKNTKMRRECLYTPGQWEKGGWFLG